MYLYFSTFVHVPGDSLGTKQILTKFSEGRCLQHIQYTSCVTLDSMYSECGLN